MNCALDTFDLLSNCARYFAISWVFDRNHSLFPDGLIIINKLGVSFVSFFPYWKFRRAERKGEKWSRDRVSNFAHLFVRNGTSLHLPRTRHLGSFANCLTQLRPSRERVQLHARCISPQVGTGSRERMGLDLRIYSAVRRDRNRRPDVTGLTVLGAILRTVNGERPNDRCNAINRPKSVSNYWRKRLLQFEPKQLMGEVDSAPCNFLLIKPALTLQT